jgi:hypothetical protein
MKIAILSDIHDHIDNLAKAIAAAKNAKVEAAIFCGDFCAPYSSKILSTLNVPIYACLGNNDEDQIGLLKLGGKNFTWTHLSQEFGTVELGGKKLAFCHYPRLADLLSKTEEFDAVFFGHTHQAAMGTHGKTLLLNPGAICGIKDGKYDEASYAIYDTDSNAAELDIIA